MIQHSIPQDITGYKFHLIGSMTLKQFGELALGSLIAFIVYKSNLIFIVKWPLFIFIVILSIMIAFVPIEERPLDFWIITYFKNLWKPTKFFWKRMPKIPDFFNYKPGENQNLDITPDVNYSPARKQRIQEYLKSIPGADEALDEWDVQYNQRADQLMANFDQVEVKAENISILRSTKTNKPQLKTRIRKLKSLEQIQDQQSENITLEEETASETIAFKEEDEQDNLAHTNIDKQNNQQQETQQANQLIGMVLDRQNEPVNNALIEVFAINQDQVLRISKSGAEGQFYIKTALPDGEYLIKTEADSLEFDPLSIRLTGRVVPLIKIIAN